MSLLDFPQCFTLYRLSSKFNLKQRYSLNILLAILSGVLFFLGIYLISLLSLHGFLFMIALGTILIIYALILYIPYRFINGRIYPIGQITFFNDSIQIYRNDEITEFYYQDLIYLSTDYERPENQFEKHSPAKTYYMQIVTKTDLRYRLIVSRLSENPISKMDLIDLLLELRQRNHHMYKSLRGVKRLFEES